MAIAANVDRALLLRRRALKKAQGRRRLAVLGIAVAAIIAPGAYWAIANSSVFAVSAIAVSGGGGSLLDAEVQQAATSVVGHRSLLQVDTSAVARAVEQIPYVRSASVDRAFPHTLAIRIDVYRAAAVVRSGTSAYLVSDDGRVLDTTTGGERLPTIEVRGGLALKAGADVRTGDVAAGLAVLRAVPPHFSGRVARVHRVVSGPAGAVVVVGRGLQLRLGAPTRVDVKLKAAARILRSMQASTRAALAYVDVSAVPRAALGYKH